MPGPEPDGALRLGDTGEEVEGLQLILLELGYSVGMSGPDGVYGPATATAVEQFKNDYFGFGDQVADAEMRVHMQAVLNGLVDCVRCGAADPGLWSRELGEGDSGDDVRHLQQLLIRFGYPVGSDGADGHFGPATSEALLRFQFDYSFDGIASSRGDWETYEIIQDLLNGAVRCIRCDVPYGEYPPVPEVWDQYCMWADYREKLGKAIQSDENPNPEQVVDLQLHAVQMTAAAAQSMEPSPTSVGRVDVADAWSYVLPRSLRMLDLLEAASYDIGTLRAQSGAEFSALDEVVSDVTSFEIAAYDERVCDVGSGAG